MSRVCLSSPEWPTTAQGLPLAERGRGGGREEREGGGKEREEEMKERVHEEGGGENKQKEEKERKVPQALKLSLPLHISPSTDKSSQVPLEGTGNLNPALPSCDGDSLAHTQILQLCHSFPVQSEQNKVRGEGLGGGRVKVFCSKRTQDWWYFCSTRN